MIKLKHGPEDLHALAIICPHW